MSWKKKVTAGLGWVLACAWQLAQIGRGRPDFVHVADDGRLLKSMAGVALAAALLRHVVLGHQGLPLTITNLAIYGLLLAFFLVRENRSRTLLAMAIGASALVDLCVSGLMLLGMAYPQGIWALLALGIELTLIWRVMTAFKAAPMRVQARRYRP